MKTEFFIRLDDACPTMHQERWNTVEELLDKYGVKPIVAVIPHNEDPKQQIDNCSEKDFWERVRSWERKGWVIALHGYNHVYVTKEGGLVPKNHKSEFAGLPLEEQKEKIKNAIKIFREHGVNPTVWVAPSHTFDENTLQALKEETSIYIISDGIALEPYKEKGFIWIPQQFEHLKKISSLGGWWTLCKHPSVMPDKEMERFENELQYIARYYSGRGKSFISRIFNWIYWLLKR